MSVIGNSVKRPGIRTAAVFAAAMAIVGVGGVASAQPRDVAMGAVREWYERREGSTGAVLLIGDSRSSATDNRVPGQIIRKFDVQFARLNFIANAGNSGAGDGLGESHINLNYLGASDRLVLPGANVAAGSGITNHFPVSIGEVWGGPQASDDLSDHVFTTMISTAGGSMRLSPSVPFGGQYFRGDPAQGRAIARVRMFAVRDDRNVWVEPRLQMAFNGNFNNAALDVQLNPPSTVLDGPSIFVSTVEGPGVLGFGITTRLLFESPTRLFGGDDEGEVRAHFRNKGFAWVGASVEYAGDRGIILAGVAQGGWTTRSHLPDSVYAPNDNPYTSLFNANGAKYSDGDFREWYTKTIGVPAALVRVEIGANVAVGGMFEELGGDGAGSYKQNAALVAQRALTNLAACGVTDVVVELVSIYSNTSDTDGIRTTAVNRALFELAQEHGWSFYDQMGHMVAGGYAGTPWSIAPPYTSDGTHQNFPGMVALGGLEWSAITTAGACPPVCSGDFNSDGDTGSDADIEDFFRCLAGNCGACMSSDFDGDGDSGTDQDIEAFFRVLAGGNC